MLWDCVMSSLNIVRILVMLLWDLLIFKVTIFLFSALFTDSTFISLAHNSSHAPHQACDEKRQLSPYVFINRALIYLKILRASQCRFLSGINSLRVNWGTGSIRTTKALPWLGSHLHLWLRHENLARSKSPHGIKDAATRSLQRSGSPSKSASAFNPRPRVSSKGFVNCKTTVIYWLQKSTSTSR